MTSTQLELNLWKGVERIRKRLMWVICCKLRLSKKREVIPKGKLDAYLAIQNRFFAIFRREVLKSVLDKNRTRIKSGNEVAYKGDFLADARLFEKKLRMDGDVFIQ